MLKTFKGYLIIRVAILVVLMVTGCMAYYVYRADSIEANIRAGQANVLSNTLAQRLEKKKDVGITNAISMASGGNLAFYIKNGDRSKSLADLKRVGAIFKSQSNFKGIKIQLFTPDYKTFLRNWKPKQFGDTSDELVPILKNVSDSGKAMADFVVDKNGFFLRGTSALMENEKHVGFLQFLQGVGSVSRDFEKEGVIYALLITPQAASASDTFASAPKYGGMPLANKDWFSNKVQTTLKTFDIPTLVKDRAMVTEDYFVTTVPLKDFQGRLIGHHILAEPIDIIVSKVNEATSTALLFIIIMMLGFVLIGALIIFLINRRLLTPMSRLADYAEVVASGDTKGVFSTLCRFELDTLAKSIVAMIQSLNERTDVALQQTRLAEEKTQEANSALEIANKNEQQVKKLLDSMRQASVKAEKISREVMESVQGLTGEVDQVAHGVEVQRDRMMVTATAMEEMNATVSEVAHNASNAARNATDSSEKAKAGAESVQSAVSSIRDIENRIISLKETMGQLGDQASSIGQVLNVITDIADQTNLLALNAAIEAARAGEAGRGFAVVADEVRKLAEKTMVATTEVENAIKSIQVAAKENVTAVESAAEDIVKSTEASYQASKSMEEIVTIVEETSYQVDSIATASEEQSATSEEINSAVNDVNQIASETAEGMRRSADGLGSITALISQLDATIQSMASANQVSEIIDTDKLIIWSEKLSVGIPSIDQQHKTLVDMINELNSAMINKKSRSVMLNIVDGLKQYVVTHFSAEEKLFDQFRYPETQPHKVIHQKFVEKVSEFEEALKSDQATVSIDVMNFLKDWLVEHIMGTDKQYGPFLKKHGVK